MRADPTCHWDQAFHSCLHSYRLLCKTIGISLPMTFRVGACPILGDLHHDYRLEQKVA
jgi:hypothetical protein